MSLKVKVALIIVIVFILYGTLTIFIHRFTIFSSFLSMEQDEAIKNAKRTEQAIKREVYHLDSFLHDWSAWDDTYKFAETASPDYISANLVASAFIDYKINLIYFFDITGKVIWGRVYDLKTEKRINLDEFPENGLPPSHALFAFPANGADLSESSVSGIISTRMGPMLIACRPILTSNNKGPIRGYAIMGRFFNNDILNILSEQIQVDLEVLPALPERLSEVQRRILKEITPQSPYKMEYEGKQYLYTHTVFPDIHGNAALLIKLKMPRQISANGAETMRYSLYSVLMAGVCVVIIIMAFLQYIVLNPIAKLTKHAVSIDKPTDFSSYIFVKNKDEIGTLANEFNGMLDRIGKKSAELSMANQTLKSNLEELVRADAAQQRSREELEGILNSIRNLIFMWDKNRRLIWANRFALSVLPSDSMGKLCRDSLNPKEEACLSCHIDQCFRDGSIKNFYLQIDRKGMASIDCLCTASVAMRNDDGTPRYVIVSAHDITEEKRLQAEAFHKSHLASIGELSAGVAHEINNPINSVINLAQILIDESDPADTTHDISKRILTEGERIASIVKSLLSFARENKMEKIFATLEEIMAEVLALAKAQIIKDGIQLSLDIPPDLPPIKVHFQQVQIVCINLISNARYALNRKYRGYDTRKRLTIRGETLSENMIDYLRISFHDTGTGIPMCLTGKVIEPFFTTKPPGEGTGLGLSICHGIISDHGGRLLIKSDEGEFTEITVDLPIVLAS